MNHVHVSFDLDGTLIDSASTVHQIINTLRNERGLGEISRSELVPLLSIGGEKMIEKTLMTASQETPTMLACFRTRYYNLKTDPGVLYRGAVQVLHELRKEGVKLSLCTNKPRILTRKILKEVGISAYFETICAGDDLPTRKPSPENLKACLEGPVSKYKHIYMVGDSTVDQRLALNAGARFIFFASGYDDGVVPSESDYIFSHYGKFPFSEILNIN
jgi:phosphoglycolate phosphatase